MIQYLIQILYFILGLFGLAQKVEEKKQQQNEALKDEEKVNKRPTPEEIAKNRELLAQRFQKKSKGEEDPIDEEEEDEEEGEEEDSKRKKNKFVKSKKIGTKKLESQRKKQEQKDYNEQMKLAREQKREKEEQEWKELKEKRELKEKEELEKEMEEKKLKDEKEKEEYDKWRHLFSVDEQGEDQLNENGSNQLLEEFISQIKTQKVVVLEELAAQFKLKTVETIERIKSLEKDGLIQGIFDDRGKFIYITPAEFKSLVDFINFRGRISINDISLECNKTIKLESQMEKINIDEIKI